MATLTVEGRTFGAKRNLFPAFTVPTPPAWDRDGSSLTLRDLIVAIVTDQVRAYNERRAENSMVHMLTAQQIEDGAARGKIAMGQPDAQSPEADAERAIATALLAFEDGLYFVFIGDRQYESLHESVRVGPDTRVVFLRLVALAGG